MTDLHCHILPGMDDGAKDTAVSLELLHREYEDGVRNIAFTSHFNSERTTVDAFTAKRQAAFEQLTAALEGQPMQFDFKLGAEVFFSPGLCELDTRALCIGGHRLSAAGIPHHPQAAFYPADPVQSAAAGHRAADCAYRALPPMCWRIPPCCTAG